MPLTRDFKDVVMARARRDAAFRRAMLVEALDCFLTDEIDAGKSILRDYVNATLGFEELGRLTGKSPKSLMRMLGPDGNPRAENLFAMLNALQAREGVRLSVRAA